MKFEGVSFNEAWVKTKSLEEFIAHEKHHFESDPNVVAKLTEAYNLITGKQIEPAAAPPPKSEYEDVAVD